MKTGDEHGIYSDEDGNRNRRRQFHLRLTEDLFRRLIFLQEKSKIMPRPSLCKTAAMCIYRTSSDAGYSSEEDE